MMKIIFAKNTLKVGNRAPLIIDVRIPTKIKALGLLMVVNLKK